MFKILLATAILLLPASALGQGYTKQEWADKYVSTMTSTEIAATIISLWDHVPDGAWKDNARDALKAQLVNALTTEKSAITTTVISPIDDAISKAGDTDL